MAYHIKLGLVVCVALFASVALQGCGCAEDTARGCITGLTFANSGTAGCAYGRNFINCIVDNGCCDWEDDGQTAGDMIRPIAAAMAANNCGDSPSC